MVRFDEATLWHLDAAEWAPSTASKAACRHVGHVRFARESGHARACFDMPAWCSEEASPPGSERGCVKLRLRYQNGVASDVGVLLPDCARRVRFRLTSEFHGGAHERAASHGHVHRHVGKSRRGAAGSLTLESLTFCRPVRFGSGCILLCIRRIPERVS